MLNKATLLACVAAALAPRAVTADSCQEISGNYYCNAATAITYENVGFSGEYSDITAMDESSGSCSYSTDDFSGTLAPLNEELSLHFRGPLQLAKFAAYNLSSGSNAKRELRKRSTHSHHRRQAIEYVTVTEALTVYYTPTAEGASPSASVLSTAVVQPSAASSAPVSSSAAAASSSAASPETTSSESYSSATSSAEAASGTGWTRSSYYDADSGTADNVVFLNNKGGSGSGVWSSTFGNSLSYCASNGVDAASSAETLDSVTLSSDVEFSIWTASECSGSACGYYREGIPAYHGFSGDNKLFLFRFQMPTDSDNSDSFNGDMPAIWALNAKIPRTLQYSTSSCSSCWETGCGEVDFFEVLNSGNDRLTSHIHTSQGASDGSNNGGGGSSDYIQRPTDSYMDAAVVFSDGMIKIVDLTDSGLDFGSSIDSSTVDNWSVGTVFTLSG